MPGSTEAPRGEMESEECRILSSLPSFALNLSNFSSFCSSSLPLEEALSRLVQIARSTEGRQKLADLQAVPSLLALIPCFLSHISFTAQAEASLRDGFPLAEREAVQLLVILLRALRNLCAGEASNQDAFMACKGVETLALISQSLMFFYASVDEKKLYASPPLGDLFKVLLQLLGNVAGRGDENRTAIWDKFFPDLMLGFAQASYFWKDAQEPLCMVLFTCCHLRDDHLIELSDGKGAALLAMLLVKDERDASVQIRRCSDSDGTQHSGQQYDMFNSKSAENEWLKLLVRELCLEKPYFPAIFANLGSSTSLTWKSSYVEIYDARAKFRFQLEQQNLTTAQPNLLCILCSILYEDAEDEMTATMKIALNTVVFLVDVISHSAQCAASLGGEACELPTGFPAIDALGYSLLLVRKLCAMESIRDNDKEVVREDLDPAGGFHEAGVLVSSDPLKQNPAGGFHEAGVLVSSDPLKQNGQMGSHLETTNRSESRFEWESSPSQIRYLLASHGLVPLMLKMLQALGPPATFEKVRNSKVAGLSESVEQSQKQDHVGNSVSGNDNESSFGSLIHDAVNVCDGNNLSESDKLFPSKNLYRGFRRDLVSIIANISYRHFYVQEQIRENNGLMLLLQQCMVDKDNPFLREWGLWAIRNLLYDNENNQQEVASLQLKGVANTSEILQTGLSVEIDPTTQRPKLVNVPVK